MTAVLRIKDENGNWVDVPAIVGPQGPRGPQGPKGDDATYTLPTASADTLGGVKVGDGLRMEGDTLGVEPEDVYELIETIIVGYGKLTEKPSDWETNWAAYYRNTGTLREPVYEQITDATAPTWAKDLYFETNNDTNQVLRTNEPDGTPYKFKKAIVEWSSPISTISTNVFVWFFKANNNKTLMMRGAVNNAKKKYGKHQCEVGGKFTRFQSWVGDYNSVLNEYISRFDVPETDLIDELSVKYGDNAAIVKDTKITMYGVRA